MCIDLWRRYTCPKAPDERLGLLLTSDTAPEPREHPYVRRSVGVTANQLTHEADNVFREVNRADPEATAKSRDNVHWLYNLVRCAHLYPRDCRAYGCIGTRIQHFAGPCPYCTGQVDLHVDPRQSITHEEELPLRTPQDDVGLAEATVSDFRAYQSRYLGHLLRTARAVVERNDYLVAESQQWLRIIRYAWPETFCPSVHAHIGHGDVHCECDARVEPWRTNPGSHQRRRAATGALRRFGGADGSSRTEPTNFWRVPVYNADTGAFVRRGTSLRAAAICNTFNREEDFPSHQMTFFHPPEDEYWHRHTDLRTLSSQCIKKLLRHVPEGQSPARWEKTVCGRQNLLLWLFQMLEGDTGLHRSITQYLGAGLLSLLNPWAPSDDADYPSRSAGCALGKADGAHEDLEAIVLRLEREWAITGVERADLMLLTATDNWANINDVVWRNKEIERRDIAARDTLAEDRIKALAAPLEDALAAGCNECPICLMAWRSVPFHDPVRLPCCKQFAGARRSCTRHGPGVTVSPAQTKTRAGEAGEAAGQARAHGGLRRRHGGTVGEDTRRHPTRHQAPNARLASRGPAIPPSFTTQPGRRPFPIAAAPSIIDGDKKVGRRLWAAVRQGQASCRTKEAGRRAGRRREAPSAGLGGLLPSARREGDTTPDLVRAPRRVVTELPIRANPPNKSTNLGSRTEADRVKHTQDPTAGTADNIRHPTYASLYSTTNVAYIPGITAPVVEGWERDAVAALTPRDVLRPGPVILPPVTQFQARHPPPPPSGHTTKVLV
ncbi:hypothetical protein CSUB01_09894 [Colletotrichum sublineola]|uniref:Uncharacterized protein n=1 Tax=Colletotrichum sublineola TaxID=1173701 RepID=A0A066XUA0_COLSU|nr:hypothetical protein CSUB01_09894 [Colletotrichum sublineola]